MEEKERYVIRYDLDYILCLIDTEKNQGVGDYIRIVNLLNQQDKRIKELNTKLVEEMELSAQRRQIIEDTTIELNELTNSVTMGKIFELQKENQKLKQQLKDYEKRYKKAYKEGLLQKQFDKDMEITQLKQQLHDLPKQIVGEIVTKINEDMTIAEDYWKIRNILDTILEKYGGENGNIC